MPDGSQTRSCHESISFNVEDETIRDRTVQPESSHEQTMLNEVNMDFRIPGLPHSVVKQAESSRVRELVKKQQDLRQSKKMIQDVGNVELFELFETDPETVSKACLSYWSVGIVYCTCGHLLKEIVANRGVIEYTMDLLLIPEYIIKKGRPHGHRYGKTPEKKEYHLVHNLKKRCIKRELTGIHDRFLRHHVFRECMLEHDRDEEVCIIMDDLAEQDFTYRMSESEYFRYKKNWWISLNKFGNTGPLRNRSDFSEALSTLNRLHWRTTTQTVAILEVPGTAPIIEFFLHLVSMEWILVVFLRIQRKSMKEDAYKG